MLGKCNFVSWKKHREGTGKERAQQGDAEARAAAPPGASPRLWCRVLAALGLSQPQWGPGPFAGSAWAARSSSWLPSKQEAHGHACGELLASCCVQEAKAEEFLMAVDACKYIHTIFKGRAAFLCVQQEPTHTSECRAGRAAPAFSSLLGTGTPWAPSLRTWPPVAAFLAAQPTPCPSLLRESPSAAPTRSWSLAENGSGAAGTLCEGRGCFPAPKPAELW